MRILRACTGNNYLISEKQNFFEEILNSVTDVK
jgi:hypothetical protein